MNITLNDLNSQIQKTINKSCLQRDSSTLRSAVDRSSTPYSTPRFSNELNLKSHSKKDLEFLCIVSYYIEETIGFLIRFQIQEMISEDSELNSVRILTQSKSICLAAIAEGLTSFKTLNELFGNCICDKNFSRFRHIVKLKYLSSRKPQRKEYRRGPTDQGTLGRRNLTEEHFRWTVSELAEFEFRRAMLLDSFEDNT